MMRTFEAEYAKLNKHQKEAVDTLEGPLLVLAGPGTGKTQLLSMRVANLLRKADLNPNNILCITFTDNAARNMRERLERIIGQAAYHVNISTFHSFGTDIINQYPDYFIKRPLLQPVDELGSYEILREIFEDLPHSDPLSTKVGDDFIFLRDTLSTISWLKQNALTPNELADIIKDNTQAIETLTPAVQETFNTTPTAKRLPHYVSLLNKIQGYQSAGKYAFLSYAEACATDLALAISQVEESSRYVPSITAWRNKWLEKDSSGNLKFKDGAKALNKIRSLRRIYQKLQEHMAERGLYDFEDMIIEVVHALEANDDLRLNLQERYQYILIDEFQDTNKAQARIIHSLGDNPINEDRPNIMAVGDDDQAIYTFQGAESSNMLDFVKQYRDVKLITLTNNYRSAQTILDISSLLVRQAGNRLEDLLDNIDKKLAAQSNLPAATIAQTVLPSELQQYQWVAEKINELVNGGVSPQEIAVIAPKHKYLERFMPFIGSQNIPVAYERKENILDAPVIRELLAMCRLTDALAQANHSDADALFGEVLTYPFWGISLETIALLSLDCYQNGTRWLECMLKHKKKKINQIALWFLEGARQSNTMPLEYMLDRLIGNTETVIDASESAEPVPTKLVDDKEFHSPFREYHFSKVKFENNTDTYLALLGQLATLRHRLRSWRPDKGLLLKDFVEFIRLHQQAGIKIIDTNPHTQTTNAIQVMTAYKAKGLEFSAVFVINAQDEVWGQGARTRSDRIRLPLNLPIKPAGDKIDDRLRLFYVALTRAKHTLFITSYTHNFDNKLSLGLSFIGGNSGDEVIHPALMPQFVKRASEEEAEAILQKDWAYRFRDVIADKPTLFEPILANYKLSATHLNNFLDIINAGPEYFLTHNLLRFPEAMTPHAAYGDAIHKTLQWIYGEFNARGKVPQQAKVEDYFCDILSRKHIPAKEFKLFSERGKNSLRQFLQERKDTISADAIIERGFGNEGVLLGTAHLTGKIDKIIPDGPGQLCVVDYKTGKPASSWRGRYDYEQLKLHKYHQQLMFYKLLVEHSATYQAKYRVTSGALEFVESDDSGKLLKPLEITFKQKELERFVRLIQVVWQQIQTLNFPHVKDYETNMRGVLQFEQDLLDGKYSS